MIQRQLLKTLINNQRTGFINIIYGTRRVGKTVLLEQLKNHYQTEKILFINGDTDEGRELLSENSEVKLSNLVKNYTCIFIDEAQRIPNIGLSLKIIIDKFSDKKVFVTGSSSLELTRGIKENLTGRNIVFQLYPFALTEIAATMEDYKKKYLLDELLIYGGYPYLRQLGQPTDKQHYLKEIVDDYLFKDVLMLERIDNPDTFKKLAILLAWQIGNEVSLSELAQNLNIDIKTVSRYLYLLEKSFVIFPLGAYAGNLRKEVAKSKKYYFYDLGIRNALVGQFLPLNSRTDVGRLWENFLVVERRKVLEYQRIVFEHYFWRAYSGAEIDLVEVINGRLAAWEFKWQDKKFKTPKQFREQYKIEAQLINQENFLEFIE
ncbi:MAG: AAA ATPase [Candidatus Kuenenbacteria bacterium GW2011_GWA2_42_15]|uniref:AAA ATPase n=1 Tax=Candidatus Kuenenbacteria bacterium GW2011_GWA2_42_15 TaxID=1618677 RepID=A0A0G1BW38_9BACT|nr:MAG: AAA ATPase [Candidatus Kuenenbacteria bacterium GW2011_GWA2_42_15]